MRFLFSFFYGCCLDSSNSIITGYQVPNYISAELFKQEQNSCFCPLSALAFLLAFVASVIWLISHTPSVALHIRKLSESNATKRRGLPEQQAPAVCVFYASQTGTAESYAKRLHLNLVARGVSCLLVDSSRLHAHEKNDAPQQCAGPSSNESFESLLLDPSSRCRAAIFVVSTFGDGEPPDESGCASGTGLETFLSTPGLNLSYLHYAVFGLGSSLYEKFNAFGRAVDSRLTDAGAIRLLARVDADADADNQNVKTMDAEYAEWMPRLNKALDTVGISACARADSFLNTTQLHEDKFLPAFEVIPCQNFDFTAQSCRKKKFGVSNHLRSSYFLKQGNLASRFCAQIVDIKVMDPDSPCLHVKLAYQPKAAAESCGQSQAQMRYSPGDHVAIWPINPEKEVFRFYNLAFANAFPKLGIDEPFVCINRSQIPQNELDTYFLNKKRDEIQDNPACFSKDSALLKVLGSASSLTLREVLSRDLDIAVGGKAPMLDIFAAWLPHISRVENPEAHAFFRDLSFGGTASQRAFAKVAQFKANVSKTDFTCSDVNLETERIKLQRNTVNPDLNFSTTAVCLCLSDVLEFIPLPKEFPASVLLASLPQLRPRLFSASSSLNLQQHEFSLLPRESQSAKTGKRVFTVDLTVRMVPGGLCSSYLDTFYRNLNEKRNQESTASPNFSSSLEGANFVTASFRRSAFGLPRRALDAPLLLVATGAGIAPMRAILQERRALLYQSNQRQLKQGFENLKNAAAGPCFFFYGCRTQKGGYLYRNELEEFAEDGLIQKLVPVFSRDADGAEQKVAKRTYVQHIMLGTDHAPHIWQLLASASYSCVLVCGRAGGFARNVREALCKIAELHGSMSASEATDWLAALRRTGRYKEEVW